MPLCFRSPWRRQQVSEVFMVRGALCKRLISPLLAAAEPVVSGSGSSRSPAPEVVGTAAAPRHYWTWSSPITEPLYVIDAWARQSSILSLCRKTRVAGAAHCWGLRVHVMRVGMKYSPYFFLTRGLLMVMLKHEAYNRSKFRKGSTKTRNSGRERERERAVFLSVSCIIQIHQLLCNHHSYYE